MTPGTAPVTTGISNRAPWPVQNGVSVANFIDPKKRTEDAVSVYPLIPGGLRVPAIGFNSAWDSQSLPLRFR